MRREREPQFVFKIIRGSTSFQMSVSLHTDEIAASPTLRKSLLAMVPNLRAFAVSLCNDPEHADDLVQETILKAWSHLDSFQEGTNLRAWLAGSVLAHELPSFPGILFVSRANQAVAFERISLSILS